MQQQQCQQLVYFAKAETFSFILEFDTLSIRRYCYENGNGVLKMIKKFQKQK